VRKWLLALAVGLIAVFLSPPRARAEAGASHDDAASLDPATQSSDPVIAATALFELAEAEDARGDYADAAPNYRAAVARLPSFRHAAKAIMRAALLEAHAEGGWEPYRLLESVRRDPRASSDPAAIESLSASADTFPPGPTRSEARMLCAEAYLSRLHRRAAGEAALRKVADDPRADGLVRREAANELVTALLADGDLAAAQSTALSLGPALDAPMLARVRELVRRRRVHVASLVDLALFGALAVLAIARAARRGAIAEVGFALRRMLPFVCAFTVYVGFMGGVLASSYETGNAQPFLAFGAVLFPVFFASRAWSAAGSASATARVGRALLSASAVVAAAFLMLELINGQYLESFKL
jgi:hypothetical protein